MPFQPPVLSLDPVCTRIVSLAHVRLGEKTARKNLAIKGLKDQIDVNGILEPLTVCALGQCSQGHKTYEVIHGSRRWMAARQLGLTSLPVCTIKPVGDIKKLRVQLINISSHRQLSQIDEAQAIMDVLKGRLQLPQHDVTPLLSQQGHTERNTGIKVQSQQRAIIEEVLSESGRTLANYRGNMLKLLSYPGDVRHAFSAGHIGRAKTEVLGQIKDNAQRKYFLQQTIEQKLTKGQLLARMGASGDPALALSDKELDELHKNVEFLIAQIRGSDLWSNFKALAEFHKQIKKWARYAATDMHGLQSAQ